MLAEANATNVITRYYIYGKGLTAMADAATNALYVYHFDGTGHTVAITNASQQAVNTYAYDPYGKSMAQQETVPQPFKYAGQVGIIDEGNNLYYMRARYYDANIGRFISEDPAGFQGGLNLYAYVGGNPIMLVDPNGLEPNSAQWGTSNFVSNYFGTGQPVNLGQVGLGERFQNQQSVQNAVNEFVGTVIKNANNGYSFSDRTGTNVTWDSKLFSVGDSTFFRAASCGSNACNFTFGIKDSFKDPLDIGVEIPGGTKYPITYQWNVNVNY